MERCIRYEAGVGGGRLAMGFTERREESKAALETVSSQSSLRHYNVLIVSFSVVTMISWYCCISCWLVFIRCGFKSLLCPGVFPVGFVLHVISPGMLMFVSFVYRPTSEVVYAATLWDGLEFFLRTLPVNKKLWLLSGSLHWVNTHAHNEPARTYIYTNDAIIYLILWNGKLRRIEKKNRI